MTSSKHGKSPNEGPFRSDLEDDPGIGQSKGLLATGEDPDLLEGVTTSEGDVENEATPVGSADEHKLGRTNK